MIKGDATLSASDLTEVDLDDPLIDYIKASGVISAAGGGYRVPSIIHSQLRWNLVNQSYFFTLSGDSMRCGDFPQDAGAHGGGVGMSSSSREHDAMVTCHPGKIDIPGYGPHCVSAWKLVLAVDKRQLEKVRKSEPSSSTTGSSHRHHRGGGGGGLAANPHKRAKMG